MRPTAAFPHPALSSGALQFPERGAKGAVRLTASQSASPPRDSCPLETTNRAPFTGGMPIRDALPNDAPKQGTADVACGFLAHVMVVTNDSCLQRRSESLFLRRPVQFACAYAECHWRRLSGSETKQQTFPEPEEFRRRLVAGNRTPSIPRLGGIDL